VLLYAIDTVIRLHGRGAAVSRRLPTFYLDPESQGIVSSDHAQAIALDIVDSTALTVQFRDITVSAKMVEM
jgi:hypothetical protein